MRQKSLLILNPLESSSCFTACFSHPCRANPKESARATKKARTFSPHKLSSPLLFSSSPIYPLPLSKADPPTMKLEEGLLPRCCTIYYIILYLYIDIKRNCKSYRGKGQKKWQTALYIWGPTHKSSQLQTSNDINMQHNPLTSCNLVILRNFGGLKKDLTYIMYR